MKVIEGGNKNLKTGETNLNSCAIEGYSHRCISGFVARTVTGNRMFFTASRRKFRDDPTKEGPNVMMNECFNPQCRKPLHYLREGRVFVFGVKSDGGNGEAGHLEHYWLCGACARTHGLAQDEGGIRMVKRNQVRWNRDIELPGPHALAS